MSGFLSPYFLTPAGKLVAFTLWMILWWAFEVVPIPVTALIPVALFPLLGVTSLNEVVTEYSKPIIFLFMGGFFLAKALEATELHKKLALKVLLLLGGSYTRIVSSFMLISFFLSMWISNTATTLLMVSVAYGVLSFLEGEGVRKKTLGALQKSLLLGIAYSSSIGGASTLIGTPPNGLMASYLREHHGVDLTMLSWMKTALPFTSLMLFVMWFFLTKIYFRLPKEEADIRDYLIEEKEKLPKRDRDEAMVTLVMLGTVLCWVFRSQIGALTGVPLSDAGIALTASLVLFSFPSKRHKGSILTWKKAEEIPWGVLLMFGGALSLTKAFTSTGLLAQVAPALMSLPDLWAPLLLGGLACCTLFFTEFLTNSAAMATLLPIFTLLSERYELPILYLAVPCALTCSFAFMFPIATPPNAIVFASGRIKLKDMLLCGLSLNVISLILVLAFFGFGLEKKNKELRNTMETVSEHTIKGPQNTMPTVYEYTVEDAKGNDVSLETYQGKVLLIVNTASKCGFTKQYAGLEKLYEKYKDQGFEILAFPCNQFGGQEPGSNEEIQNFCSLKFKTTFPVFAKLDVNGKKEHPLFGFLKKEAPGILGTEKIKWNFTKFLVDKEGRVVSRFASKDEPSSLEGPIKELL